MNSSKLQKKDGKDDNFPNTILKLGLFSKSSLKGIHKTPHCENHQCGHRQAQQKTQFGEKNERNLISRKREGSGITNNTYWQQIGHSGLSWCNTNPVHIGVCNRPLRQGRKAGQGTTWLSSCRPSLLLIINEERWAPHQCSIINQSCYSLHALNYLFEQFPLKLLNLV